MNPVRSSHPSAAQVEMLVDLLERKPHLAKGFSRLSGARQAASREWGRIAQQLNSMGGSIKTAKKWIKYWTDKKSAVKRKAAERSAARNITGGGMVEEITELSHIEERIVLLMGGEGFATGDRHLQIQPFNEPTPEHESPSILPPVAQQGSSTCTIIMPVTNDDYNMVTQDINTTDLDLSLGHRGHSLLMHNLLEPESVSRVGANITPTRPDQCFTEESISERNRDLPTPSNATMQQQFVPEPVAAGLSTTDPSTRRRRRRLFQSTRRNVQSSPPSQRRTNLMGMAEKFLRLEQRRMDLDERMVAVMERNSERDHLLMEAVKALADAIKR